MFDRFPFSYRVALLLGLMTVAAAVDYWRRGREATRYREYSFIWIAGMLGGLVGFANDCVTSSMSPDYFTVGKGLEAGNGLRWRAGVYGCEAGFSAGAIGGAVCLFVRGRNSRFSTEQMRRWLRTLWMPVAGAIFLGLVLPIVAGGLDPLGLSARLGSLLNTDQIGRFRRVWWIHMGLYAGLIIGLAAMILRRKGDVTCHPESV
jgi:hypothetical protein